MSVDDAKDAVADRSSLLLISTFCGCYNAFMRQHLLRDAVFIFLIAFFLFTRLYKLPTSFFYFNDMGRDSLALLDWAQTGKPPLLGPQTSALPFNQGAVYYYLLYPLFRLMQHSPFSAILTSAIVYVVTFSALFYFLRNKPTQVRARS